MVAWLFIEERRRENEKDIRAFMCFGISFHWYGKRLRGLNVL
jgi:hypothetical protein